MSLQNIIETAFENRADITPTTVTPEVKEAVLETIRQLDSGKLRVAERLGVGEWKVNEWAKKAVLLSFRIQDNEVLNDGVNNTSIKCRPSLPTGRKTNFAPPVSAPYPVPLRAAAALLAKTSC